MNSSSNIFFSNVASEQEGRGFESRFPLFDMNFVVQKKVESGSGKFHLLSVLELYGDT